VISIVLDPIPSTPGKPDMIPMEREYAKSTIYEKLFCWVCGLYQTESQLCLSCNSCNRWTLSKIQEKPVDVNI
jgi:hypothetical protein